MFIEIFRMTLLPVYYLAPIEFYAVLTKSSSPVFEVYEHFKKQTYRNRCCIYGANGKLNLVIPIKHTGERTPIKDVKIANENNWQKIHWRSIEAAYRTSSYFEFYEHLFVPYYEQRFEFLADFNFALQEEILKILGVETKIEKTNSYKKEYPGKDFRNDFSPKPPASGLQLPVYPQVFSDKFGFIPGLSIMDLIFNMGNQSLQYLSSLRQ